MAHEKDPCVPRLVWSYLENGGWKPFRLTGFNGVDFTHKTLWYHDDFPERHFTFAEAFVLEFLRRHSDD